MRFSISELSKSRRLNDLLGVLYLSASAAILLSILSYDASDATWFNRQPEGVPVLNWVGRVGATMAEFLLQLLGVAAVLVPLLLVYLAWCRLRRNGPRVSYGTTGALLLLGLALTSLLDLLYGPIGWGGERSIPPGGLVGTQVAGALQVVLNRPGALIFSATVVAALVILLSRVSYARVFESAGRGAARGAISAASWLRETVEERRRAARRRKVIQKHARNSNRKSRAAQPRPEPERRPSIELQAPEHTSPRVQPSRPVTPVDLDTPTAVRRSREKKKPPAPRAKQQDLPLEKQTPGYVLPPIELLQDPEPQTGENEKDLLRRAELLTQKFREFAVDGSVVAIHPGPVVTTFEFKPDAGVKYSKITSLTDDLCLALKAVSVRIDRMPGKSTVGIEVPNRIQETIYPRELIDSDKFRKSDSKLVLALGKNIGGEVFVSELDRMPHLLIAGATGAGKSVGLNGMIASILYKATPTDVRFIMIDTKMIELGIYADVPHLLIPVVTEPKNASAALKWAVREMEARYRKLASVGVRNIAQFNDLLKREPDRCMVNERTGEEVPLDHLPYIVIVIDEMADLMMVSSADVEESVMRLAQMARAVGIHLILATQRPSVDVITGTIKANFPCRIAFRVSQRVDSRTIIDTQGAEQLLGRGDMLFLPPGSSRLLRLHGGFVTEAELNRITTFLKKTAKPVYDESVLEEPAEEKPGFDDGERDEYFVPAVELILQEGQCSITMIQRRLRLGYARAARIVDSMEQAGIIGPADGSKPREVLVGPEILETLQAQRG
jgi:S-DNA-T family DNA segregation ATPase FtsK/SpoIIIE